MIILEDISIRYGNQPVFEHFSNHFATGEKIALAGPSGSGKSTLLNALMGFVPLASGKILIDGEELKASTVHHIRKQTAWLPQDLSFNIKSNKDLVYYPFTYASNKKDRPTIEAVEDILHKLLLPADVLQKDTNEISGGQKQRLMLASVMLLQKPILLLDEPTSALDNESINALLSLVKAQKDTTVVSTSHDSQWLSGMDRVIEIKSLET